MKEKSRSAKAIKNSFFGFVNQFIKLLFTFVSRTIFIKILGEQYLGVNGLYSNILTVLSLADMGLGNVMLFSLYKPILEKDNNAIVVLLKYYKKLYRYIMIAILILGILFIPFLRYVVNSDLEYEQLVLYYILNLFNSVASYIAIYKSALINADQKNYIVSKIQTFFATIQNIGQAVLLVFTGNYALYLCFQVLCTLLTNITVNVKADKLYPFLKEKVEICEQQIINKRQIIQNLKSTFLYRSGTIIMNYTDNILISVIIGTVYVGYYSNYSMLVSVISTFLSIVSQALISGLGNLNAEQDKDKSYYVFCDLVIFYQWISTTCSICFIMVINDFITIWIGKDYLLSTVAVMAIVFNFYIGHVTSPVWMYRETCGLFSQIKYVMLIASVINIILSIILGRYWGIAGIIAATPISRILTVVWYEPGILFREIFKKSVRNYWKLQSWLFFNIVISVIACSVICRFIAGNFLGICIKVIVVIVVTTLIFAILNNKLGYLKKILQYFKS
jgi:O-antigen/teichoic acid export membrane protein